MWSYLGGVRAYCDRVFSPIFADFRGFLQIFATIWQNLAKFGKMFGLIFRARWAIFCILTQNIEELDPGAVFAPRECFFGFLMFFSSIWPYFRRCSSSLGHFRPGFLLSRSISCKILKKHAMFLCCKAPTPHPNMTALQYFPMISADAV